MPTASYLCEFINTPHWLLYSDDVDIFYRHVHVRACCCLLHRCIFASALTKDSTCICWIHSITYLRQKYHPCNLGTSLRDVHNCYLQLSVRLGGNCIHRAAMFCSLGLLSHPQIVTVFISDSLVLRSPPRQ